VNHSPRPKRGIIRRAFEPDTNAPMPSTIFWSRIFLYILIALSAAFVFWISVAKIGQVVPAQGKLIPAGSAHEVQAPVQGVISEVMVHNGDSVKAGQILMKLNQDVAAAEMEGLQKQRAAVTQDLSALEQKRAQKAALEQQIPRAADLVRIKKESYDHYSQVIGGVVSKVEILDRKADWVNAQRALDQLQSDFARVSSELDQQEHELTRRLAEIDSNMAASQEKLSYHEIKAPLDGVIFDLQKKAVGTVVTPKDKLCDIIPGENLVAEVFLTNKDIGFVREGLPAIIRFDTFPFREFGEIKGNLIYLAADSLPPNDEYKFQRFPAKISLNRQFLMHNGEKLPLKSGMATTVNIQIRSRTLLSILTDEFSKPFDSLETVR
jgi:multidrug efflux pump subunit AcrA (membrane-fusion protein)